MLGGPIMGGPATDDRPNRAPPSSPPTMPLETGHPLRHYRIVGPIGAGAMGEVCGQGTWAAFQRTGASASSTTCAWRAVLQNHV